MKDAANAMKKANKDLDIDDVNATMDDINEINDVANEISDAIARVGVSNEDDDELLKELEGLKQEKLDEDLLKISKDPVILPEVPNTDLPTKKDKLKDDEDLKQLEQWAN